jgi:hypothetical protein
VLDIAVALPALASLALGAALVVPAPTEHLAHHERERCDESLPREAGRCAALRALRRIDATHSVDVFVQVLRTGSDSERSLAVDGLAAAGSRDALVPALNDPLDAIAAKAALAYVGSNSREDYRAALAPFVPVERIEALLALLGGYLA